MTKTILLGHGRQFKPPGEVLEANWIEAIRHGREPDRPNALDEFDAATIEMVYYGDVSNECQARHNKSRLRPSEAYDPDKDIADRRQCLDELKARKGSHFNRSTCSSLPGASGWKEGSADVFAGPPSLLGLSGPAVHYVAPDMADDWGEATDFGSRVRALMVRPLIEAFERGDDICVISHSLGSLIAYDTFRKFSHMSE